MSDEEVQTEEVTDTPAAPEEGTSGQSEFTNFRLEDVPDEYRDHVQKAYDQFRGDYSRKTAELAEQRKSLGGLAERREEAENALAFIRALNNEEQRETALKQLIAHVGEDTVLDLLGIDLEDNGDDDDTAPADKRVDELWEREQAREAEAAEAAEAERLKELESSIDEQIDRIAKDRKIELNDKARAVLWSRVLDIPPNDDGPQVQQAFDDVFGLRDEWIKSYRDSKRDPGQVPVSGSSASPSTDLSDEKGRLAAALAVANRHLSS